MTDYDFKSLNDKEFEIFCTDLLGEVEGRRFERFKAGRDSGVDGRYFTAEGKEVVLQCKHWSNTPIPQLISKLRTIEKPKIDKLKPHRYLLIGKRLANRIYYFFQPMLILSASIRQGSSFSMSSND